MIADSQQQQQQTTTSNQFAFVIAFDWDFGRLPDVITKIESIERRVIYYLNFISLFCFYSQNSFGMLGTFVNGVVLLPSDFQHSSIGKKARTNERFNKSNWICLQPKIGMRVTKSTNDQPVVVMIDFGLIAVENAMVAVVNLPVDTNVRIFELTVFRWVCLMNIYIYISVWNHQIVTLIADRTDNIVGRQLEIYSLDSQGCKFWFTIFFFCFWILSVELHKDVKTVMGSATIEIRTFK